MKDAPKPVDVTPQMIDAGLRAWEQVAAGPSLGDVFASIYLAMRDAAPTPALTVEMIRAGHRAMAAAVPIERPVVAVYRAMRTARPLSEGPV